MRSGLRRSPGRAAPRARATRSAGERVLGMAGTSFFVQAQQLCKLAAQAGAGHNGVNKPVLLQIFGPLKTGGQLFANCLADDARPGKPNQRAGLCQRDVA